MEPLDESCAARDAADRGIDLSVGVFADPIYLGRLNLRGREEDKHGILRFSQDEWEIVSGSSDLYVL